MKGTNFLSFFNLSDHMEYKTCLCITSQGFSYDILRLSCGFYTTTFCMSLIYFLFSTQIIPRFLYFGVVCGRQFELDIQFKLNKNYKCLFCIFYSDHSTSPVLWRGCGSSPPNTPLISMSNMVVVDFSSNLGSSGSGFRIVAEEISSGCGGILHGMVRSSIFTKLSKYLISKDSLKA